MSKQEDLLGRHAKNISADDVLAIVELVNSGEVELSTVLFTIHTQGYLLGLDDMTEAAKRVTNS